MILAPAARVAPIKQQSCRTNIRNNQKSLIEIFHLSGKTFRLSLTCPSRPTSLVFHAMALPHLKWPSCLLSPAAHAAGGSGPYRSSGSSFSVPAAWWHLKGKCFIYWTLACLIPVRCLSTSILTGKLGTQIPHIELLVDLYCDMSEKLSTAEKETVLYSKYLGDVNSKSSVVLFYSCLRSQEENETGTTSSGRNSSHHIPFTSVLCQCEAPLKNVNANVCSFWFC